MRLQENTTLSAMKTHTHREYYRRVHTVRKEECVNQTQKDSATQKRATLKTPSDPRPYTPAHENLGTLYLLHTSAVYGKLVSPTFHGYECWGVIPMYNVCNFDWQLPPSLSTLWGPLEPEEHDLRRTLVDLDV